MIDYVDRIINKLGMIHGRFQPFHNGHLIYALEAWKLSEKLIIGITNPDPSQTKENPHSPHRHLPQNNPFTFWERFEMIKNSLLEHDLERTDFEIIPFPINYPERWKYYLPPDAVHFIRFRNEWSQEKIDLFKRQQITLIVLKNQEGIDITGMEVRRRLAQNQGWQELVPNGTGKVLEKLDATKRLRKILSLSRFCA